MDFRHCTRPTLSPPGNTDISEDPDHCPDQKSTYFKDEDLNVDLHKRVAKMCPTTQCSTSWWSSSTVVLS